MLHHPVNAEEQPTQSMKHSIDSPISCRTRRNLQLTATTNRLMLSILLIVNLHGTVAAANLHAKPATKQRMPKIGVVLPHATLVVPVRTIPASIAVVSIVVSNTKHPRTNATSTKSTKATDQSGVARRWASNTNHESTFHLSWAATRLPVMKNPTDGVGQPTVSKTINNGRR